MRNTGVQGWLSVIFLVLSVIVIITAIIATIKAYPNGGANTEDPEIPSKFFAPSGLISSPSEKELEAAWKLVPADQQVIRGGH